MAQKYESNSHFVKQVLPILTHCDAFCQYFRYLHRFTTPFIPQMTLFLYCEICAVMYYKKSIYDSLKIVEILPYGKGIGKVWERYG